MMRETRTLKGLFPDPKPPCRKNFIKENVKSVRKMEQLFHTNNKSAKDLKLPVLRQTKIINKSNEISDNRVVDNNEQEDIESGVSKLILDHKSFQNNRKKSAPVLLTKKTCPKRIAKPSVNENVIRTSYGNRNQTKLKAHSEENVAHKQRNENVKNDICKCKSQGVQTLDTNDIDDLYSEGVIRYSSGKTKETKNKTTDGGDMAQNETFNRHEDTGNDLEHPHNENVDYVKLNKERVTLASKLASQLNSSAPPPNYRYGVVPKYIKERKEALQKEQLAKIAAKQVDCPNGHVPLPDNERKDTLNMLKKNYQEYISELNMLPIRTDTLRSHRRKVEIEKQLTKLEEAIKVFSRPKVFVKVDS